MTHTSDVIGTQTRYGAVVAVGFIAGERYLWVEQDLHGALYPKPIVSMLPWALVFPPPQSLTNEAESAAKLDTDNASNEDEYPPEYGWSSELARTYHKPREFDEPGSLSACGNVVLWAFTTHFEIVPRHLTPCRQPKCFGVPSVHTTPNASAAPADVAQGRDGASEGTGV